jgi:hypothetical protein
MFLLMYEGVCGLSLDADEWAWMKHGVDEWLKGT